jgi:hypothetical protein
LAVLGLPMQMTLGSSLGSPRRLAGSTARYGSKLRSRQYPAEAGERVTIVSGGSSLVK